MAAMECKRKPRKRIDAQLTAKELEAAETLLSFCHFGRTLLLKWGAKRRRSQFFGDGVNRISKFVTSRSPVTPLSLSCSETEDYDEQANPSPPQQSGRMRSASGRKTPKKKTRSELREMANALSSERDRLKEEEHQILKTYRELQERNELLKSELALHLNRRQELQLTCTLCPAITDSDMGRITETSVCFDEILRHDGHDNSNVISVSSALGLACDETENNGRSIYPHHPESSSRSGEEYLEPTKDVFQVGIPDDLSESWSDVTKGGFSDHMLHSMNKAALAAEARKRRIELTRVKYCHSQK
ncbi:hypothetical protein KI387_035470, partial [Taxus chinensis]